MFNDRLEVHNNTMVKIQHTWHTQKSVRPEVRETTDFNDGAYSPHPKRPPRTPSRHSLFFVTDGRAETDR